MLKQVRIRRFKAIDDSGDIRLDKVNVFIGRNGSGKSSVIEFLELLANAIETDIQTATVPFRRGRDVIRGWTGTTDEALLSLVFDPGDVSAGDSVHYEFGISAPSDGEILNITTERLWIETGESRVDIIKTESGIRQYQVPPTRPVGKAKRQRKASRSVGDRQGSEWIRIDDAFIPALKHIDSMFSQGGHALRSWLEGALTLRLSPTAVAEFAPRRRRRGKKDLDPLGYQTAELLSALSEDERVAVLGKLKFVTAGFAEIVSHEPSGPGDQRYFYVKETSGVSESEIPAWVLSEGTRRLTAMLAVSLREHPIPLLMIEEVENGFDPWTLRFVLEELVACSESGAQVILTTHSPYLMNMLPREVFHFVSRHNDSAHFSKLDGNTAIKRVLGVMGVGDAYTGNLLGND